MQKKTTEQFIKEASLIHPNYDYSLVDYKGSKTKVKIICPKHGLFLQRPDSNLKGAGCPKCANEMEKIIPKDDTKKTNEQFIKEAKLIHPNYDYSQVDYKNNKTKVKIICPKHGVFFQTPHDNLTRGCPFCGQENRIISKTKSIKQFIKEAKEIHGDRYDYSLADYKNSQTKIKIICNTCKNVFLQRPVNHLNNQGCPYCKESKGEKKIRKFLEENKIDYFSQKTFPDLKDVNFLSYDFYLPKYNLLIEYNGEQHYKWIKQFYLTFHDFHKQLHHDWLKRKYAKKNGITLLVIPFWNYKIISHILKSNHID